MRFEQISKEYDRVTQDVKIVNKIVSYGVEKISHVISALGEITKIRRISQIVFLYHLFSLGI